jgi:hypothetical protein
MNRRHFLKLGAALPLLPCVITTAATGQTTGVPDYDLRGQDLTTFQLAGATQGMFGTFTIHYLGQTFGPFDYDATPEEIGRAMEGEPKPFNVGNTALGPSYALRINSTDNMPVEDAPGGETR